MIQINKNLHQLHIRHKNENVTLAPMQPVCLRTGTGYLYR